MKEHPILFSGEMVRAILEGRKTQTRRVIKPQPPEGSWWDAESGLFHLAGSKLGVMRHCPYGVPGDHLWVRETHHIDHYPAETLDAQGNPGTVHYRADTDIISQSWDGQWRLSIFMPRWASRITLLVTGVRVEQVQDISEDDARAEGIPLVNGHYPDYENPGNRWDTPGASFISLWDSINRKRGYSWQSNPWVWAVTFEVLKQ